MDFKEIVDRVDMVEFISQYVDLTRKGDDWWGVSPFSKKDTDPSFSVTPSRGLYYDFSANIGGDLLNFIENIEGVTFSKAVDILCAYLNIDSNELESLRPLESVLAIKKYKVCEVADKNIERAYLEPDITNKYSFDIEVLSQWNEEGISWASMKKFGVMYDAFSNRIVYPIKDIDGRIINISGRTCDQNFKEKRIRKYTYFYPLGVLNFLYGFSENIQNIQKLKEVIIVEGAKSVMKLDSWNICNSCALLTSHLNIYQMRLLMSLKVKIVFALDNDINIKKDETIVRLSKRSDVYYIKDRNNLLGEKDSPTDCGYDVFCKLYELKRPL